ncbi:MAG TPA: hypothetical protein ENH00_10465 [Actinobacteria bacterium]|nr:hypothetical protein [Actinomycetota bacterium]HDL49930.1 hypothetical protein [Actinomycetota bacterium]
MEDARTTAAPPMVLSVQAGRVIGLVGMPGMGLTRVGLSLLAEASRIAPVAYVDVRGWFHPPAAWEAGIDPERLVVVRNRDRLQWSRVTAALLEGMAAVYAEVPDRVPDQILRRLAALTRSRRAALVLRPLSGDLPSGVAYLRVRGREVVWDGADDGHGRLLRRRLILEVSGKNLPEQVIEVEDDGTLLSVPRSMPVPSVG